MRFSVLASGSSGNACYIETEKTKILIDAGLSCREFMKRLEMVEREADHLDAIVITHEHFDHIKGAGPISRRFGTPVYINPPTLGRCHGTLGRIGLIIPIDTGQMFVINDIIIKTFTKCHDAADPIGLTISHNSSKLGFVTDLGRSTKLIEDNLKECKAIIMEFNHDERMLNEGPYPIYLKKRIKGTEGHLSNKQAGDLLRKISHENLTGIVLAHISKVNNLPDTAYKEADEILKSMGLNGVEIFISQQENPLEMIEI